MRDETRSGCNPAPLWRSSQGASRTESLDARRGSCLQGYRIEAAAARSFALVRPDAITPIETRTTEAVAALEGQHYG